MPGKHDPADCLADIIENAERIAGYLGGLDRDTFARDGMRRDAVERCLERICEAAHRLGDRATHWYLVSSGAIYAAWGTGCAMRATGSAWT